MTTNLANIDALDRATPPASRAKQILRAAIHVLSYHFILNGRLLGASPLQIASSEVARRGEFFRGRLDWRGGLSGSCKTLLLVCGPSLWKVIPLTLLGRPPTGPAFSLSFASTSHRAVLAGEESPNQPNTCTVSRGCKAAQSLHCGSRRVLIVLGPPTIRQTH